MNPGISRSTGTWWLIRPERALLSGIFVFVLSTIALASDETIPPDSWIYPALRTFELRGLVGLEPSFPYSRSQVERYLDQILSGVENGGVELSTRQRFLLGRLQDEFRERACRPQDREDRPVFVYWDGNHFAAVDVTVGGALRKKIEREKGEANGLLVPGILVDLGQQLTLETSHRIRIEPERGRYRMGRKPSPREKSWRGATVEYERGYLSVGRSMWRLQLGRDYFHWGNGRSEGLLLSQTAGSLDHVAASVTIGRFRLSTVHAFLDPDLPRHLAGHRLTARLPGGVYIGISESVIYTGRAFDFTYVIPTVSYYANQYGERGDDNVLWGVDVKIPVRRGLLLYGELLIDDLQYESDPPAPHRLAYNVTAEALVPLWGRDVEIQAEYTFIDIYTYAHRDSLVTRYVTGEGSYPANPILGSPLGPDADRLRFNIGAAVHPRVTVVVASSFVRRGDGNDLREWDWWREDPDPPFPSGTVVSERIYGTSLSVDLGSGSTLATGGGWIDRSWDDVDQHESYAFLELVLDL